ncbi:hypothetical protein IPJ91_02780 [bacterium]|nr:MAG: hypothetical protein IPJ91_02780 [bacterium]
MLDKIKLCGITSIMLTPELATDILEFIDTLTPKLLQSITLVKVGSESKVYKNI